MTHCDEQTVPLGALAPAAIELLEYLVRRQKPADEAQIADIDGAVDEWLIDARAARRWFHQVATPALRSTRNRAAMGMLTEDYEGAIKYFANRKGNSLIEMVDEVLEVGAVQDIMKRSGIRPNLIGSVRDIIKQSDRSLRVDSGALILVGPDDRERKVIDDTNSRSGTDDLLRLVARTWTTRSRGLAALVVGPDNKNEMPDEISWTNGLAHALVQGSWFFDRDVRNLEDLRSLPAIKGNSGAAVVGGVAVVLIVVGLILIVIAKCVDDPTLSRVLGTIGLILTILGIIVAAASGAPVEVCRTDPDTGVRECGEI